MSAALAHALFVFIPFLPGAEAVLEPPPQYGPAKGTLFIVGGGYAKSPAIVAKFIELAGGPEAKLVVVPTAKGNLDSAGHPRQYEEQQVIAAWQQHGFKHVRMLHTSDRGIADTEEFTAPLREANAVWLEGGRQWNLVDSYKDTRTEREFHELLARGGVIGGSSAGAMIQGDYLVRGAVAGSRIVITPEKEHEHGFGFLRQTAIDQHIDTRARWDDLVQVVQRFPNLLGIGISEATAIVVHGDRFDVIGQSQVAIHDPTHPRGSGEKPYLPLSAGQSFDLGTRSVVQPSLTR